MGGSEHRYRALALIRVGLVALIRVGLVAGASCSASTSSALHTTGTAAAGMRRGVACVRCPHAPQSSCSQKQEGRVGGPVAYTLAYSPCAPPPTDPVRR